MFGFGDGIEQGFPETRAEWRPWKMHLSLVGSFANST